jgi:Fe/S biogenesis protein NfuA
MSPLEAMAAETSGAASSEPIIVVTPEALEHLRELRDDEADGDKLGLRLAIASDPGEEFRYDLSFEEFLTAAFTDEVRTHDGMKVIIPGDDVELLTGATLDYTPTQGLVIRNPNRPAAPSIEGLTADDELSAEIEALVATEVNPALAAHGGFVTYVGHDGEGTAYLTMGGGCHGCSMSKMTMLDGVQTMLVDAIDGVERVKDLTDHSTGENPFYSCELLRERFAYENDAVSGSAAGSSPRSVVMLRHLVSRRSAGRHRGGTGRDGVRPNRAVGCGVRSPGGR